MTSNILHAFLQVSGRFCLVSVEWARPCENHPPSGFTLSQFVRLQMHLDNLFEHEHCITIPQHQINTTRYTQIYSQSVRCWYKWFFFFFVCICLFTHTQTFIKIVVRRCLAAVCAQHTLKLIRNNGNTEHIGWIDKYDENVSACSNGIRHSTSAAVTEESANETQNVVENLLLLLVLLSILVSLVATCSQGKSNTYRPNPCTWCLCTRASTCKCRIYSVTTCSCVWFNAIRRAQM